MRARYISLIFDIKYYRSKQILLGLSSFLHQFPFRFAQDSEVVLTGLVLDVEPIGDRTLLAVGAFLSHTLFPSYLQSVSMILAVCLHRVAQKIYAENIWYFNRGSVFLACSNRTFLDRPVSWSGEKDNSYR